MIILVHCKLNRFFRREMLNQGIASKCTCTDDEFDDFDNMFAGCAFE